jgi:cellulose synthase/poly-beta-1,6-N-acetylglucosamine synthase-like glycosyltransferase
MIWPTLFWISTGTVLYSYVLYPVLLAIAPRRREQSRPDVAEWPTISILLSVYNEEKHIAARIENLLALEYPADKIEILIGSDGSTDNTDNIVRSYNDTRIRYHLLTPRGGKPRVLNFLATQAQHALLVFTDANTMFERDALRKLAQHFHDPRVGGVCGYTALYGERLSATEGPYWRLENFLKQRESDLDSCLGANGPIYAIRRTLWPRIPDNTFIDDFVIAMRVREQGFRVLYDREAVATEELAPTVGHEMTRRIRIGAGDFQSLFLCWRSLLPWRGAYVWSFWSHKVLRWFGPFFMLAALAASVMLLAQPFYAVCLGLQLAFYVLAIAGAVLPRQKFFFFTVPHYFVTINLAVLFGFFRFITGTQRAAWKRTAR